MAELAEATTASMKEATELVLINNRLRWTSTVPVVRAATLDEKPAKAFTARHLQEL